MSIAGVAKRIEHRRYSQVQQPGTDVLGTAKMFTYMVYMHQIYFSHLFNPFGGKKRLHNSYLMNGLNCKISYILITQNWTFHGFPQSHQGNARILP
jgi:hypothetical protein